MTHDRRQVRRAERSAYGRTGARSVAKPRVKFNTAWLRPTIFGVVALLAIAGVMYYTRLNSIVIHGSRGISSSHLHRVAQAGLERQWFGGSLLLFDATALEDYIIQQEPAVKALELQRSLPNTLVVQIIERQPSINWKTDNHVYLLDVDGTIIGDSRGDYLKLPTVIDTANLPVKVGERVAPSSFVQFCARLAPMLTAEKIAITELRIPETTSEVHAVSDKGFQIKFDTTRPVAGQVADLKVVLGQLTAQRKVPTSYIDLRIESKAYYK